MKNSTIVTTKRETALIKIIDEINCIIVGLRPSDYDKLKDKFSPYAPNYRFTTKYKLGIWDGKIPFFSKAGKTYIKLLPEIIPLLKKWGYTLKLEDNRQSFILEFDLIDKYYFVDEGIELGDHQVEGVNAALQANGGILLMGTGAGKSIAAACLCKIYTEKYNLKAIMIVPNTDLIGQGKEDFENLGLDVGEYSGDVKDLNHPIVISTWQALQNNPQVMSLFQISITDECHGVTGKQLQMLLNDAGSHLLVRIGLTGTLPEEEVDRMAVRVTLGDPVFSISSKELIDLGWLAKPEIEIIELVEEFETEYSVYKFENPDDKISYRDFTKLIFADYDAEKKYLNKREERQEFIADIIIESGKNEKANTLMLVNGVEIGKRYAELIPGSIFVYAKDKKEYRRKVYKLFAEHNDVVVIATAQLASTGLNIPRIFHLVLVDIGKSYIKVIQAIGRGLRKAKDKDSVVIIDICSTLKYSNDHKNKRISHYKKHEYPFKKTKIKYRT